MNIQGSVAIITGGASGLGAATARMLVEAGAKVTILDFNPEAGEDAARKLGVQFEAVDVTSDEGVDAALTAAQARHGVARILVNCAGIAPPDKTIGREGGPHSLAMFRKVVDVNLSGVFNVVSKFAARLHAAERVGEERGVIVNTASVAAFDGQIGQAAYAASKGGVAALTLPLARDLAGFGIRVMTIAPGIFMTPMLAGLPQAAQDSLGQQTPFPARLGQPSEYAALVRCIITNPMLNAETIRLDGAIRMAPR